MLIYTAHCPSKYTSLFTFVCFFIIIIQWVTEMKQKDCSMITFMCSCLSAKISKKALLSVGKKTLSFITSYKYLVISNPVLISCC